MPKRNTTDGLLAKFDNVVVEDTLNIKETDLGYCERMQKLYDEKIAELNEWLEQLWELHDKNPKAPHISLEKKYGKQYAQVDNDYTKRMDAMEQNPFAGYSFSMLYGIDWINNKKIEAQGTLIRKIVSYFNSEYNLNTDISNYYFVNEDTMELKQDVHFKPLVRNIIEQCGGVDLTDVGIERMKEAFRKNVGYNNKIKVTKNKLTIADFFYFSDSWSGIKWDYSDSRLGSVRDALSYFEFGELGDHCHTLRNVAGNEVDFQDPYEFLNFSKVESMKVFKNGRVDFKFYDNGVAQEFYDFFELHKLPESRW